MSSTLLHPYHLVDESPWPLLSAGSGMLLTSSLMIWFNKYQTLELLMSLTLLLMIMFQWWRDISIEGTMQGLHSGIVTLGLRWGMALFIISEICFFFSFFWAFFHCSLAPDVVLGSTWPPLGIMILEPHEVPLLNTLILILSGITVTWSHHSIMMMNFSQTKLALIITVILGIYFTFLQMMEYYEASFSISDSIYGSTFFLATGFHGFHVLVGTSFLFICLVRINLGHFNNKHHFGFEAAIWYWHFVDVVWLFLYISIYCWGNK